MRFDCSRCGLVCETEVACLMHEKSCAGEVWFGKMRVCSVCGVWMPRAEYAMHVRTCDVSEERRRLAGRV